MKENNVVKKKYYPTIKKHNITQKKKDELKSIHYPKLKIY